MNIRQDSHEQPRDFYNCIVHLVQIAGLTNENSHYMVELAFMSGLHQPIADQVRTFGLRAVNKKVNCVQNYWLVKNPVATNDSLANVLPTLQGKFLHIREERDLNRSQEPI